MEDQARRSGLDRRQDNESVSSDRRQSPERRSVVSETDRMIGFLKKIPVFNGLTYDQYKKVLYICYNKIVPPDCMLFEEGDKSDSMFILIRGQIKILYHKRIHVVSIDPVGLCGEIGFFSGASRKTSAVTTMESSIIKINKTELFRVFHNDNVLSNRMLINVIKELSGKLEDYTEIIQELRAFKDSHSA